MSVRGGPRPGAGGAMDKRKDRGVGTRWENRVRWTSEIRVGRWEINVKQGLRWTCELLSIN